MEFNYQLVGGKLNGTYESVTEAMLAGAEVIGAYENTFTRAELQCQPIFKGYLGPMYNGTKDGKVIIRYETQEVYDKLSC